MRLSPLVGSLLLLTVSACRSPAVPPQDASSPPPAPSAKPATTTSAPPPPSPLADAKRRPFFGPVAALTGLCGEGCKVEEQRVSGAGEIDRLASLAIGSQTYLAVHTKAGWFTEVEKIDPHFMMMSHHSPRGAWIELDGAIADAGGVRVARRLGGSNFIGGMGNRGSSSFRITQLARCEATVDGVSCTEPVTIFDEHCAAPMDSNERKCEVKAAPPSPAVEALLTQAWAHDEGDRWVPDAIDLPPRHFREKITFDKGGVVHVLVLAPSDAHYRVTGTWAWEGPDRVKLTYREGKGDDAPTRERTLRVLSIDASSARLAPVR